ncbi:hypothetical protein K504DRAFT_106678 [Pleomassaria siparia CBS 279.74]|uniref:Uncharacterized protein n=1 Tax=Pleomassaria siparia CBS 279.74 TaxID=1314801 RepID=A0A6G1JX74_9PLEO|nr:hypothetical protein K504DRAFT_106678 [Pleomassaria siparia CBS 279.74]
MELNTVRAYRAIHASDLWIATLARRACPTCWVGEGTLTQETQTERVLTKATHSTPWNQPNKNHHQYQCWQSQQPWRNSSTKNIYFNPGLRLRTFTHHLHSSPRTDDLSDICQATPTDMSNSIAILCIHSVATPVTTSNPADASPQIFTSLLPNARVSICPSEFPNR